MGFLWQTTMMLKVEIKPFKKGLRKNCMMEQVINTFSK